MRAIVGAKYNAHISDNFHHLRILKLEDIQKITLGKIHLIIYEK